MNARLLIAGIGPDLEEFQQQAVALGLNEHISFLGKISNEDRDRLYHTVDMAVFPSIYEPFGIVALEAMAAECPVVVTQTGGLQEIVCPHETGITVVPNNVDSLVWGILHTLQNPVWARARAINALCDLRKVYSWQHVAQEVLEIYYRVCTHCQSHRLERELIRTHNQILLPVE
jgi:glycosyltransferase involved in cell wall biosynthesis